MVDRDHIDSWGVNARLQPFQAIVASHVLDEVDRYADTDVTIFAAHFATPTVGQIVPGRTAFRFLVSG